MPPASAARPRDRRAARDRPHRGGCDTRSRRASAGGGGVVPIPFDVDMAELIGTGHAARGMLQAVSRFCGLLGEETLKAIDDRVVNATLTPEAALALCYELAAYRRIVMRLRQQVVAGEKAAARQAADHEHPREDTYA